MALILNACRQISTYDGTQFSISSGDSVKRAKGVTQAFLDHPDVTSANINGQTSTFRIQYRNPVLDSELDAFEIVELQYVEASPSYLIRVTNGTETSSAGDGAVDWSTDSDALELMPVVSNKALGVRTLQEDVDALSSGSAITSTTFTEALARTAVTPRSSASKLIISFNTDVLSVRTALGGSAQALARLVYLNSSSLSTQSGEQSTVGHQSFDNDANAGTRNNYASTFVLDQTNLNASGDWEFVLELRCAQTDCSVRALHGVAHYKEIV